MRSALVFLLLHIAQCACPFWGRSGMRNAFVRLFFITHYTLVHLGVRSALVRLFFIAQCARPGLRRMFAAIEADFFVWCFFVW